MKTRIHIHREKIVFAGETKHFLIKLPPDCWRVVGLKTTATPLVGETSFHHIEVGNLRLSRDGMLLYETQVRYEAKKPNIPKVQPPGLLDSTAYSFQSGSHTLFDTVLIACRSTTLFAKYNGNPTIGNYEVKIYVRYETKNKKA